jgi:Leucine-rich repeat (LRR) protein
MKYFVLLVFLFSFGLNAQIINFPDQNFKNKLLQADINNQIAGATKIDTNNNGEIEESEALQVTYLFLFNSSISNLEGIEYFTNLQYLFVHQNSLVTLNITSMPQLITLRCNNNNLSSLNLTGLIALEGINLMSNNISSLNTQSLPNLKSFYCAQNQISSLDFSNNPQLTRLYCSNNNLTSLTIKNGINQDFSNVNFNDCWKTGNPNLTTICADESEIASVQSFLEDCGGSQTISVNSNCNLTTQDFKKNQIAIYPNPVNDVLNINLENSIISSVTVFNTLGQKVYFSYSTTSQIDVSKLEAGAYFLKVDGLEGEYFGRFVKK